MDKVLKCIIEMTSMSAETEGEVYKYALETCQSLTKSTIAYFHFLTADQVTLSLFLYSDNTKTFCTAPGKGTHYPLEKAGWWADSIRERKVVYHNDTTELSKNWPKGHIDIFNHMSVPIFEGEDIIAVLGVGNRKGDYTEEDTYILQTLSSVAWNIGKMKNIENEVISLRSIIPICANCKKIKDGEEYWERVEDYISNHIDIKFSHGLCEECSKELYDV